MAPLIVYILVLTTMPLEYVWRVALGFGSLPPIAFAYFRYKRHFASVHEQIEMTKTKVTEKSNLAIKPGEVEASRWELIKKHKWTLFGTSMTWLLLDITFYANGLFKETIVTILGLAGGTTSTEKVIHTALASLTFAAVALPGYWVSIALVDRWGRRPIQILGFCAIIVIFAILGAAYHQIVKYPAVFFILYGLTFFFSNFGANSTTYIIPGEAFPVSIRSTCHGISAASGKGVMGLPYMLPLGLGVVFGTCAGIAGLGLIFTLIFTPETKGVDLADLNEGRVLYGYGAGAIMRRRKPHLDNSDKEPK